MSKRNLIHILFRNPKERPAAKVLRNHPYLNPTPGWVFQLSDIERSPRFSMWRDKSKGSIRQRNSSAPAPRRHRRTVTDDIPPPVPSKPRDSLPVPTLRATDHLRLPSLDASSTLRPPSNRRRPSRSPSTEPPPIVYITPPSSPVRVSSRNSISPATSESTRTSASPQPRKSFYVVNPDPEDDERASRHHTPYVYKPPPLPADTSPRPSLSQRSQRRPKELKSRSSVADLKVAEKRLAPAPSMQDLGGRLPLQQSMSMRDESYSESDSDSNAGTLWKKPPVPLQKTHSPNKSSKSAHRRSIIEVKRESTWAPRPDLHDVYSNLQDFFPRVDLDKPIVAPSPSGERQRRTKSIRMVAETNRNNLDNSQLHRTATKLWGHKVEEVKS
jgi:hypothetical protein